MKQKSHSKNLFTRHLVVTVNFAETTKGVSYQPVQKEKRANHNHIVPLKHEQIQIDLLTDNN